MCTHKHTHKVHGHTPVWSGLRRSSGCENQRPPRSNPLLLHFPLSNIHSEEQEEEKEWQYTIYGNKIPNIDIKKAKEIENNPYFKFRKTAWRELIILDILRWCKRLYFYFTYSILEGFIHSTSLQVCVGLALPLVEVKIMTPKPTEKKW